MGAGIVIKTYFATKILIKNNYVLKIQSYYFWTLGHFNV